MRPPPLLARLTMRLPTRLLRRRKLLARMVIVNMAGLAVLAGGVLTLSQSRQMLTTAYEQSLKVQAAIIARTLSQAAQRKNSQFFEPSLLNRLFAGRQLAAWQMRDARRIMRNMRAVTPMRLRLYARNGNLILDSESLDRSISVISRNLPPLPEDDTMQGIYARLQQKIDRLVGNSAPVLSEVNATNGHNLPEVAAALKGRASSLQRQDEDGHDILTVAVPVQGYRAIIGALMVSTRPGEINAIIAVEHRQVFELTGIALLVVLLTSLFVAGTIVAPIRRLAQAMRGFGQNTPQLPGLDTIPDFSNRGDEIGDLSGVLRDMMQQLLLRINSIDRFAADVAHELKNPLTSLHSAVQSLVQADDEAQRRQLTNIIQQDVQRLNRLISDISNATRLDAELNRGSSETFDLSVLAREIGEGLAAGIVEQHKVELVVSATQMTMVTAQKLRIAQIIDNLLSNAASFTPGGGHIYLTTRIEAGVSRLIIADEGPGLIEATQEKIFERFYTDRQRTTEKARSTGHSGLGHSGLGHSGLGHSGLGHSGLGHSGLGLSISRQIARAHGGDLTAENRPDGIGACFTLDLPLAVAAKPSRGQVRV